MQPIFKVTQLVCLRAEPSRLGPIIEILPPVGGQHRYRVFHSPTQIGEYHEEQLVAVDDTSPPNIIEALAAEQWLEVDSFRARLTASRLSNPEIDNLYALQAARIQFIPFQFKPLLRFLRADQPRLLIADEVGVGKTIEAGLILRELQTRQQLDNVLIVCGKKDLVPKWQKEMRRFDEDFHPLTAEALSYCLRESHQDGAWPPQYSRAIVHLELLRMEKYLEGTKGRHSRPGLRTLDPPPKFDLIIVDEAHHLRNPGTSSHEVAQLLCDMSEAVIFLSATPLHLGNRNLYTLLNLLRPDLFLDETVFNEMVQPNEYINKAMRHIRHRAPANTWVSEALQALTEAADTNWGKQVLNKDFRFTNWCQRLSKGTTLTDSDRISCLRDLEEVHTLAHVMNRTRRRDIGKFTIREPQTIPVSFTQKQQEFYDALLEFRTEMLLLEHDAQVVRLVMDTLERQVSSCLPALVPLLDRFLRSGKFSSQAASDDEELDENELDLPSELIEKAKALRQMAIKLPPDDPKLEELLKVTRTTITGEGSGKLLVFSFFLHTLSYLEKQLKKEGYRLAVITSKTSDEDRELLRERFRLPREHSEAIDIFLSSEVGCEGLDYEFCDRLVNYDIPWNPMRIEQRIGRIDRYGQKSEKVLIYNFITPGTVEERIFFRCFERLGIFQETIGDLEEVLGEMVQDLTRVALDPKLTPKQAAEKAQQTADNALRLAEEQQRLESEGGTLLGLDTSFTQEVDTLIAEGRFIKPGDLRLMIEKFIAQPNLAGQITVDSRHSGLDRLRLNKDARNTLLEKVRALGRVDRSTRTFIEWLEGSEAYWTVTFDQQTALEQRDIPFITPIHPLAQLATHHWANVDEPLVTQIVIHENSLPSGRYLFVCDLWETVAVRSEVQLAGQAWNLDLSCLAPDVSASLVRLLSLTEQPSEFVTIESPIIEQGIQQLDEATHQKRLETLSALRERNNNLLNSKLASLDAYYQNRLIKVENDLKQAKEIIYFHSPDLEVYFKGNPDAWFLDEASTEQQIFAILGVSDKVRVFCKQPDYNGNIIISKSRSNHQRGLKGFDPSCEIDGLLFALENPTPGKSLYVWNNLLWTNLKHISGEVQQATNHAFTNAQALIKQASRMGNIASNKTWLPDRSGKFYKPCELSLDDLGDDFIKSPILASRIGVKPTKSLQQITEELYKKYKKELKPECLDYAMRHPEKIEQLMNEDLNIKSQQAKSEDYDPNEINKQTTAFDYITAFETAFNQPGKTELSADEIPLSPIANPRERGNKIINDIKNERKIETSQIERFKKVPTIKWESKNTDIVRGFLKNVYGGKCQICNVTFAKRSGDAYFEGLYIVSYTNAGWIDRPANVLCLCANCCAKFKHGSIEVEENILEQVRKFRPYNDGGSTEYELHIKLCGDPTKIRFDERHMMEMQKLLEVASEGDRQ